MREWRKEVGSKRDGLSGGIGRNRDFTNGGSGLGSGIGEDESSQCEVLGSLYSIIKN